jgi:tripartite ATP-independent transporter DctM subunit
MLAGIAMSHGGIARRIFDFSESLLSFLPGSLGSVNIMASMIFGGMSGSSVADVAGLGSAEITEMVNRKYPLKYATAITVASSTMAVIIPPSILLIIYATIASTSVGEMLAAGLIPGLFIAVLLLLMNSYFAIKNKWSKPEPFSLRKVARTSWEGLPALMAPAIILGGIFLGTFTPTEASAIAFVYSILIGAFLYRDLTLAKLYTVIYEGGRTSGIVALELGAGLLFSNLMTIEGIPNILAENLGNLIDNPWMTLILLNLILLIAGMFLNPGFSLIVFTPLLLPIAQEIGFDPIHFGVIMVTNLALGLITPPVGACLYIGSVISGLKVEQLIRELLPFYFTLVIALVIIILWPWLSIGFVQWVYS